MERFLKSRYRIGEKISENPFSVTYRGVNVTTDKPIIVKIYKRGTLNSSLISRMKQKVKEFTLITHHGIGKLIDGDYGWQGYYYVREYLEGETLQSLLERGQKIGIDKAEAIVEEVSKALEFAHGKEMVHGALKPSNVFIDTQGMIKVTDFVIEGEITQAMPQKALSILEDGKYISPEELAGKPASYSSDIYALGMILLELANSKLLPVETGIAGNMRKLRQPLAVNQEIFAHFPRYLQEIIGKALQADPLLRFSSITEFRESLHNKTLATKPVAHQDYIDLFENTVTQYGGEEVISEKEAVKDLGKVKLLWRFEKYRNWILIVFIGLALLSGLIYAFLFVR